MLNTCENKQNNWHRTMHLQGLLPQPVSKQRFGYRNRFYGDAIAEPE
jgi:hypothetical protein